MKYSEFKAEVEKLGFTYSNRCEKVSVEVDGQPVMDISTGRKYIVDNFWDEYQQLNETTRGQLFDLAFQLAKTTLADREEEKRYWLKLKTTLPVSEKFRYLVLYKPEGEYIILNKGEGESHKSIFTESEIAQMDITGFEKVEVTE